MKKPTWRAGLFPLWIIPPFEPKPVEPSNAVGTGITPPHLLKERNSPVGLLYALYAAPNFRISKEK